MAEQEIINLGIVGISNKGEYNSETQYEKLNVVSYQGSSYCALKDTLGNLPTDTTYWQLYAQKGSTGPEGPKPVKGVDYYTSADKEEIEEDLASDIQENVQNEVIRQIGNISDGSPLPAQTLSDMVDTTRLYVLLTDGYVYYYNGSQWVQGWMYQSTGIPDKSITKYKLDNDLRGALYKTFSTQLNIEQATIVHLLKNADGSYFSTSNNVYSLVVPISNNTKYIVQKVLSQRFGVYTSENYPEYNGLITSYVSQENNQPVDTLEITSGPNDNYLTVYYFNSQIDTLTEAEIRNSLHIYEGIISEEKTQADFLNDKLNAILNSGVNKSNLDIDLKSSIYKQFGNNISIDKKQTENLIKHTSENKFVRGTSGKILVFPIESEHTYIVTKMLSARFALYLSENYPEHNGLITSYVSQENNQPVDTLEITSGPNDNYLSIYYFSSSVDTISESEILASIKVYKDTMVPEITQAEYLENKIINNSILGSRYIKLLSSKQLGVLTKGYIAISCDDGANSLSDVTVDLFKGYKTTYNKNIPLTMGLMKNSSIFADTTRKDKVLDLINNYGASVAIHGTTPYVTYSSADALFEFLDEQKEYLTNNLVAPTSIIYPNHEYNELTSVIAGSYYGVCCTGGINRPITYNGESFLAGPRSNMYTIYRFSLFNNGTTTQKIKDAIDYAYEHNMIFTPFFHDNTLANDYTRCKALLDYCVDYANSKGLTFINIGDIPNII